VHCVCEGGGVGQSGTAKGVLIDIEHCLCADVCSIVSCVMCVVL
jgi:hypothetical protein